MPEIAIKQTLKDAEFRTGLNESAVSIQKWGKEASRIFTETRTPLEKFGLEVARLDKLQRDGYLTAETYGRKMAELQKNLTAQRNPFAGLQQGATSLVGDLFGGTAGKIAGAVFSPATLGVGAGLAMGHEVVAMAEEFHAASISAEKIGVSLHQFEILETAARKGGVSVDTLSTAMERLEKTLGDIGSEEGNKASLALQRIGLDGDQIKQGLPFQALEQLAGAIGTIPDKYERASIEAALFGRSGMELDLVLRKLAGGFQELEQKIVSGASAAALAQWGKGISDGKSWLGKMVTEGAGTVAAASQAYDRYFYDYYNIPYNHNRFQSVQLAGPNPVIQPGESRQMMPKEVEPQSAAAHAALIGEIIPEPAGDLGDMRDWMAKQIGHEDHQKQLGGDQAMEKMELTIRQASVGADELTAKLIAGSSKFAGDMDRARSYMAEAKTAAQKIAAESSAEGMERGLDLKAWGRTAGVSAGGASLLMLAEQGLPEDRARKLARNMAFDEASSATNPRRGQLAENAGLGSSAAYDVMAHARGGSGDKQAQIQQEANRILGRLDTWLSKIYTKTTQVAEVH